jgi:hypothetical protein
MHAVFFMETLKGRQDLGDLEAGERIVYHYSES